METVAVYTAFIVTGTVVVLAALKVVERIDDFPRKACLFGAAILVGYGLTTATSAASVLFYYLGTCLLAAGLPPRWGIYPAAVAAIAPFAMNVLEMVSFKDALSMFAIGGVCAASVGVAYWGGRQKATEG